MATSPLFSSTDAPMSDELGDEGNAEVHLRPVFSSTTSADSFGSFNETWVMTKRDAHRLFDFIQQHTPVRIFNPLLQSSASFQRRRNPNRHPSVAFFAQRRYLAEDGAPSGVPQELADDVLDAGVAKLNDICRRTDRGRGPHYQPLRDELALLQADERPAGPAPTEHIPADGTTVFPNDLISPLLRINRYSPGHLIFALTTRRKDTVREVTVPTWTHLFE